MKEFIEKLIKELETGIFSKDEIRNYNSSTQENMICQNKGIKYAIRKVNELAEEYNNGWISVKDKLPTETGKYLVTVKNLTGYWILKNNVFVCDYQFDDFIFQGWEDNKVIAWQPLPQPYKENENGKI